MYTKKALFMSLMVSFLFVSMGEATNRGLNVTYRTPQGDTGSVRLYDGCYALVIGCGDYQQWPKLPNPVKDARDVSSTLEQMGWNVTELDDPKGNELKDAVFNLITGVGRNKENAVLFWFSGHGHTLKEADGTKLGYIVPVDAPNPNRDELGFMRTSMSMREIETVARRVNAKHVLMVFDSCFSGSLFNMTRANPSEYIEEKVSLPVRQFITAGNENEEVPDRSVFKVCFLQAIKEHHGDLNRDGYVTGEELGSYIQEQVINYSRKTQHPQYGKINNPVLDKGDFVFINLANSTLPPDPVKQPTWDLPDDTSTSFEELKQQRLAREAAEKQWLQWLDKRQGEYDEVKKIDADSYYTREEKLSAWQKFQSAIQDDNPFSSEDENIRRYVQQRLDYWQNYRVEPTMKPYVPTPASSGDYIDNGDGTVTHRSTGLMWTKQDSWNDTGGCLNWIDAKKYVSRLTTAGYSDWRLPTIDELKTIFDQSYPPRKGGYQNGKHSVYLPSVFPAGGAIWYWSSEEAGSCCAHLYAFNVGMLAQFPRTECYRDGVRAVRHP